MKFSCSACPIVHHINMPRGTGRASFIRNKEIIIFVTCFPKITALTYSLPLSYKYSRLQCVQKSKVCKIKIFCSCNFQFSPIALFIDRIKVFCCCFFPLYPEIFTVLMILQRPRIIVGNAGFEPGSSSSEVWRATNEPPHKSSTCYCIPLQI